MMFNRKIIVCTFLILLSLVCRAAGLEVQILPENITTADNGSLVVNLPADAGNPQFSLPQVDGIRWSGSREIYSSSSSINGKATKTLQMRFGFHPSRLGKITIPELTVTTSAGKTLRSKPFTFTVKKAPELKVDEAYAGETAFLTLTPADPDRKKYYDGEEITLHLNVLIRSDYGFGGNPVFDFSAEPEKSILIKPERELLREMPLTVKDVRFHCYVIAVKAVVKGNGPAAVYAKSNLILQDQSSFFGQRYRKNCSAECTIDVASLPAPPAGVPFAGVVGAELQFEPLTMADTVRAGEPLTVQFRLSGNADLEKFRLPELKADDFRSYPPEITLQKRSLTFRQTLIPLKSGSIPLKMAFSVFDVVSGAYQVFSIEKTLNVEKGVPAVAVAPAAVDPAPVESTGSAEQDDIYYLIDDSAPLTLPLWRNALMPSLILILSAILLYTALYFLLFRKKLLAEDPAYLRKRAVRSLHKDLLRRLEQGEQPSAMTSDLMEYLTAVLDLPPGASLSEAADAAEKKDPEFASILRELAAEAWLPATQRHGLTGEKQKMFRSALAKLSVFLLVFLLSSAAFALDPVKAYDEGRFQDALNLYLQRIQPGHAAASDLYNAGNCYCKLGDYARGLVMYERALKLDPQNDNIRANRDFLRSRLELKAKDRLTSPGDLPPYLMRLLRVDQWIIAGVAGAILAFGTTGFFFFYRKKILLVLIAAGMFLIIAASVAAIQLHHSEINDHSAIIVTPDTKVYSLPSVNGTVKDELGPGCEVFAGEIRQEWVRIRFGEEEGWVRRSDLLPLKVE